ncbi:unnamed protein product, partial [Ectocarpus sp. 12 AP-2014]
GILRREQAYVARVFRQQGKVSCKHGPASASGHGLAFVRGGMDPGGRRRPPQRQRTAPKRNGGSMACRTKRPHSHWRTMEKDWLSKFNGGEWTEADYKKKLQDTREMRKNAKQEFLAQEQQQKEERAKREAREKEEREQEEAYEQARRDQACWKCEELDHRANGNDILLCD